MMNVLKNLLYNKKYFDDIDTAFADFIGRLHPAGRDPWVALAAALVSHATRQGHVCLNLDHLPVRLEDMGSVAGDIAPVIASEASPRVWRERLVDCPSVGAPGDFTPMVLDGYRLYLHRYWAYEQTVADYLLGRCGQQTSSAPGADTPDISAQTWFPEGGKDQQKALEMAVRRRFCVISGGPGTGKTYTLAKIMMLLGALAGDRPLRIKLAAPTGKAAARLQDTIDANLRKMADGNDVPASMAAEKAQTLHRLLAIDPQTGRSRFTERTPLPADVVIVDEASMIDLSLMARLIRALPAHARLILSGDKDQLASVEAGSVLGDICHGVHTGPGRKRKKGAVLNDHIVVLRRNFRFERRSGIHDLCRSINHGDSDATAGLLADSDLEGIGFHPVAGPKELADWLVREIRQTVAPWFAVTDPHRMLDNLNGFKILTVVRHGPFGVGQMNRLVEQMLNRMGLIPSGRIPGTRANAGWYPGRPVMVTRNDYPHAVFNGDIGVAVATGEKGGRELKVAFSDTGSGLRFLAPHQLPAHETAYATTVHKSQGSEFDRVILVLPDQDMPLLTREMVYTAVTRARGSVVIAGMADLLAAAVQRPIRRTSGLKVKLWPSG